MTRNFRNVLGDEVVEPGFKLRLRHSFLTRFLTRGRFGFLSASRSSTNLVHAWRSLFLLITEPLLNHLDRIPCKLDPLLATQQLQQNEHAFMRT